MTNEVIKYIGQLLTLQGDDLVRQKAAKFMLAASCYSCKLTDGIRYLCSGNRSMINER